jgi:hypothetical protein
MNGRIKNSEEVIDKTEKEPGLVFQTISREKWIPV